MTAADGLPTRSKCHPGNGRAEASLPGGKSVFLVPDIRGIAAPLRFRYAGFQERHWLLAVKQVDGGVVCENNHHQCFLPSHHLLVLARQ